MRIWQVLRSEVHLTASMAMRRLVAGVILTVGLFGYGAGLSEGAAIPAVRSVALNGDSVNLPEALKGKVGVLVVGFSQSARPEVTAWATRIAADYRDVDAVAYYELPMLGAVPRMLRGLVMRKISADVPERAKRRFLPVYDHEAEWRAAVGFGRSEDAYVLVVDGNGVVRYRTEGEASERAYAEVKKRVEGLR